MWSRHKVAWNINLRSRDDFRDIFQPGSYEQAQMYSKCLRVLHFDILQKFLVIFTNRVFSLELPMSLYGRHTYAPLQV